MSAEPMKAVPFDEAITWAKGRGVVLPEEYYHALQGVARAKAFSVSGVASLDQLQAVLDGVNKHLAEGKSFRDFQKDVAAGTIPLELPVHRLDNIYRTNVQSAYNAGRWNQQTRNATTRPYLMYDAINDSRTRPAHLAMDGIIRPADDPFWRTHYPPNGFRCRCVAISLTEKQAERRGGVTENLPMNAQPDPGWDYNPGEEPMAGVDAAKKKAIVTADPRLAQALQKRPEPPPVESGKPVSAALVLPKSGEALKAMKNALAAIDAAHWDGELPVVPFKTTTSKGMWGAYAHTTSGRAHSLKLSPKSPAPEFTVAHEVGHFLDHQAIGKVGEFASAIDKGMEEWRNSVLGSKAVNNLAKRRTESTSTAGKKHIDYLLDKEELFARSYAQWVAKRTGDAKMMEGLDYWRNRLDETARLSQWDDDDFEPIAAAIDSLFRLKGWIK